LTVDRVSAVLRQKGYDVLSIGPEAVVQDAVEAMCRARVGSLLVCRDGQPIGTFTERDLMARVVVARREPARTRVREVMTPEVICVEPETPVREAMAIMTKRRCRHLPVVSGGRIVGMVSIGDLVRHVSREQEFEIRMLRDYVSS
jgi:CBS domain-containing protein